MALQTKTISANGSRGHHKFTLSVTENNTSVNNNTSYLSWKLVLAPIETSWNWNHQNTPAVSYSVTINGTTYSGTVMSYDGYSTVTVDSGTMTVAHNDDGSKSINYSFSVTSTNYNYLPGSASASGSMALTYIARASQPSCITWPEHTQNVGEFGDEISIHMNRKSSSFTHTVRYQFGSLSGTIATGVTTGTTWVIPLSFMSLIPTSTSGSGTIYVDTYNGASKVGTKWCGFTAKVPASVKPTCSIQVLDATNIKDTYGNLVKGLSRLYVKTTGTQAYSSPIASYNVSANGVRYTAAEITTGYLGSSGTITVKATVTDSRGRVSAQASASFPVLDYAKPVVSALAVRRCNADGTLNNRGEYVKATFSAAIAALNNKNGAAYKLRYKKTSEADSAWKTVSLTSYTNKYTVTGAEYVFAADSGSAYNVELIATDNFYTDTYSTTASTAFTLVHYNTKGDGLSFGEVDDESGTITNALALKQKGNRYAYQAGAFNGDKGYTALAVISIKELNANAPITFVLNKRGMDCPMTCHIRFVSSSSTTDPALDSFVYEGDNYGAFLVKTSTSTWMLYVDNTGGWSNPCVLDWYTSKNNGTRIAVTFPDEQIASLPDPFYRATPMVTQSILDCFMPVGYILLLYSHADPNTMYPGTTWVRIQNAFLWAIDGDGGIGVTGGEKTVKLTTAQMPKHNHGGTYTNAGSATKTHAWLASGGSAMAYDTVDAGGGEAHNNMPPYVQVSVWRRTV